MLSKTIATQNEAARAQIADDVDALIVTLQTDAPPRQSPTYRWLDIRHDELLARLGGQRVNWAAFAAHLKKLGLTDGKGAEVTASVARNTWHRVKIAHTTDTKAGADGAQSTGASGPAHAHQNEDEGSQQASGASPQTSEAPVQGEDAALNASAPRGNDYPPGVRALAAPGATRDSAPAVSDLPRHSPSAAPDHAPLPFPSEGKHHAGESVSWVATFITKPPAEILDLLKKIGGKWDGKSASWSGTGAIDPIGLAAAVKAGGGSFQSHQAPS